MKNDAKVAVVVNILYWGASKHKLMCLGFGARWVEGYDISLLDINLKVPINSFYVYSFLYIILIVIAVVSTVFHLFRV